MAPDLARESQRGEARDLALALDARGMVLGELGDEARDAVAQLQREVRGGGAEEHAHLPAGDLPPDAVGMLGLAHGSWPWEGSDTGSISRSSSRRACAVGPSARSSP